MYTIKSTPLSARAIVDNETADEEEAEGDAIQSKELIEVVIAEVVAIQSIEVVVSEGEAKQSIEKTRVEFEFIKEDSTKISTGSEFISPNRQTVLFNLISGDREEAVRFDRPVPFPFHFWATEVPPLESHH